MKKSILLLFVLCLFSCDHVYAENTGTDKRLLQPQPDKTCSGMKHVIVYKEPGKFCGWPANNGARSWGNEILVCFNLLHFKQPDRSIDPTEHHRDRDKPGQIVMARSIDGGESWSLERPDAFKASQLNKEAKPSPDDINFAHPDFALRMRNDRFHISYDRGKTWLGSYRFPDFGTKLNPGTDYIVNSKNDCMLFLSASNSPLCVRTTDGGKTFKLVSSMKSAADARPDARPIMPSTVRVAPDLLISAVRELAGEPNVSWIDVFASSDNGKTWKFLSKVADADNRYWNGNPPGMVKLHNGRICVTYGYRAFPYGIRARTSSDSGKTWDDEIVLRGDGRNWDLGYCRTVQRPDGQLVTIYYYSTKEQPEQHIAATIWDPSLVNSQSSQRYACTEMAEHITAIEQSIKQISTLTKQNLSSVNPIVWWTQQKEKRLDQLTEAVIFFMTQQMEPVEKSDNNAYRRYAAEVTLLHGILFYSGRVKRSNAMSNIERLRSLLAEFRKVYFENHRR